MKTQAAKTWTVPVLTVPQGGVFRYLDCWFLRVVPQTPLAPDDPYPVKIVFLADGAMGCLAGDEQVVHYPDARVTLPTPITGT